MIYYFRAAIRQHGKPFLSSRARDVGACEPRKGVIQVTLRTSDGKTVYVNTYIRRRFGKLETVCDHYRRPPR